MVGHGQNRVEHAQAAALSNSRAAAQEPLSGFPPGAARVEGIFAALALLGRRRRNRIAVGQADSADDQRHSASGGSDSISAGRPLGTHTTRAGLPRSLHRARTLRPLTGALKQQALA